MPDCVQQSPVFSKVSGRVTIPPPHPPPPFSFGLLTDEEEVEGKEEKESFLIPVTFSDWHSCLSLSEIKSLFLLIVVSH